MSENPYDLVVIGSGPAGQKGAIAAAKLGKRVAVVDREEMIGGVSLQLGTIPSKTVREAILYLTGFQQRAFYGSEYRVKEKISIQDLSLRVEAVVKREMEIVRAQLSRNGIEIVNGTGRFVGPHTIEVSGRSGTTRLEGAHVLIACGTRAAVHPRVPCDGRRVVTVDQLNLVQDLPRRLIVVGAGVIGLEYASMLAALGTDVTLIDQRPTILDFVDAEITEALAYQMRRQGTTFRLGEHVAGVERGQAESVVAVLESGKRITADALVYAVGRQANTDTLNLDAAHVPADDRGRIAVNEHYQTSVPHIYAAGDVIGFPALAATSMEQGRRAASHMFGVAAMDGGRDLPYGIYTVPEIAMIGRTERELTAEKIPYAAGTAKYEELAKGIMLGDRTGLMKILFDPESLKILGVHVIGDRAAEIIHIGQAVMALGGTLIYFRDTVFNYPTLAEAYKVAALHGLNRIR